MSPWKINLLARQVWREAHGLHTCSRLHHSGRRSSIPFHSMPSLTCLRQIRGLPVVEALMQLKFSRKQKGPPIVAKVIQVSGRRLSPPHLI